MENLILRINDAPAQLIAHCLRLAVRETRPAQSDFDPVDVAALVRFLTRQGEFETHDEWVRCGMALRLALGDDGFSIWQSTFNETVTEHVATSKWNSFSTAPEPGCVTLQTFLKRRTISDGLAAFVNPPRACSRAFR